MSFGSFRLVLILQLLVLCGSPLVFLSACGVRLCFRVGLVAYYFLRVLFLPFAMECLLAGFFFVVKKTEGLHGGPMVGPCQVVAKDLGINS